MLLSSYGLTDHSREDTWPKRSLLMKHAFRTGTRRRGTTSTWRAAERSDSPFAGFELVRQATLPAPNHALKHQCVGNLQQCPRPLGGTGFLERHIQQADIHDFTLGAGLFCGVENLDMVAYPERPGRK